MATLIPYFIVGIGAWVLYSGIRRLILTRQSKTWSWVEGEIISSDVKREPRRNWGDPREAPRAYIMYSADIRYQYEVNEIVYVSSIISLDASKNYIDYRRGVVENFVKMNYPPGAKVRVFYDPNNPLISALDPEIIGWGHYLSIAIGGALIAIGIWSLLPTFLRIVQVSYL